MGPATEATVKELLGLELTDTRDDAKIQMNILAANAFVARQRIVKALPADLEAWPYEIVLGTSLLAARWTKRSNSPAGVIDLGGDAGVAYVQRKDPDIGMMLELGDSAKPAIG